MQVDHHSLFYLFTFIYLCFITPFHFTPFALFLFSSCSMFDLGSTSIHYTCLFDYVHSFIITFRVGTPRSGTHDVFYALHLMRERYGDYIIGIFEPSFISFLSPYYLNLVMSRVLRPPWGHDFTYYVWRLTLGQYSRLVEDYFLGHDGWEVGVMDYIEAYLFYQWWIFRGDVIYTRAYPAHQW